LVTEYGTDPIWLNNPAADAVIKKRAAAAGNHSGNDRTGREHMRQNVDFPDALPIGIGGFVAAQHDDAGIGAKQVHRPVFVFGKLHQSDNILFLADIAHERRAVHF